MQIIRLLFLGSFLVVWAAHGQGRVTFNNRILPNIDAPVARPDGTGAGSNVVAQLFLVRADGGLAPLYPPTTFRTTPSGPNNPATLHTRFYVNAVDVAVPGVPAGSTATIRMRAWVGVNWDTATLRGESNDVTTIAGDNPSNLYGLRGFALRPQFAVTAFTYAATPFSKSVSFTVTAPEAQRVLVQVSEDLHQWVNVQTNIAYGGVVNFSEFAPTPPPRFYRAVLAP